MSSSSSTSWTESRFVAEPFDVVGVDGRDRRRLIEWLDGGLREGRRGRLEAEYPVSLRPTEIESHRVIRDGGNFLSHAMYHLVEIHAPMPLRVGMIGLVYTEPSARGRGLAKRCIESCVAALEHRGAAVALLWSDKPAFYARLGFHPFGEETRWVLDANVCRDARLALGGDPSSPGLALDAPRSSDWPELEAIYANKRFRVERESGALEALASAPDTICVVARRDDEAVAYAALGRGDDFQGVVHEWGGAPRDVLACYEALSIECGPLIVHAGPEPGELARALTDAGARTHLESFALARTLDANQTPPSSLYLWGFDSI